MLEAGDNLLGRDTSARVHIDHSSVSRRHALISIRSDVAILEDLKSRNGTFLDGRRIAEPVEIHDGAIVGLGPVALMFVVLSTSGSTRPMRNSGKEHR